MEKPMTIKDRLEDLLASRDIVYNRKTVERVSKNATAQAIQSDLVGALNSEKLQSSGVAYDELLAQAGAEGFEKGYNQALDDAIQIIKTYTGGKAE